MKKLYIYIFFAFIISSCDDFESVIDLEIPNHQPLLVLNGVLDTDTTTQVTISNSVGAFSNATPYFIPNANVILYKDNEYIDTLKADLQNPVIADYYSEYNYQVVPIYYYKSDHQPDKDAQYRITVSHPNYTSISASTYIPDDIVVYNKEIDTIANTDKIGLSFSFDDNPNQKNYYRLKVFTACNNNKKVRAYIQSNDPSFANQIPIDGYTFEGRVVVFSDALFNGQQKNISLDIDVDYDDFGDKAENIDCDTIMIQFSTFSEDTYDYFSSTDEQREKGFADIFGGENVPVFSNIENGIGVLISINAQDIYIKP
tara:strand:- start:231 stop:1172 length:942 start_codon:yes stop_codon:yes gene_type:complete